MLDMNLIHHNTSMTSSVSACRQDQCTSILLAVWLSKHGEANLICVRISAGTSLMLSILMTGSCAAQPAAPHCRSLPSQPCRSYQHEQQPGRRGVECNQESNLQEGRLQVWHSSRCSMMLCLQTHSSCASGTWCTSVLCIARQTPTILWCFERKQ